MVSDENLRKGWRTLETCLGGGERDRKEWKGEGSVNIKLYKQGIIWKLDSSQSTERHGKKNKKYSKNYQKIKK